MDFFDTITTRQSIRAYTNQPVEEDKLQCILEAANHAPSAGNRQAFEIYLVRSLSLRQNLVKAAGGQEFLAQAPVVLVFCTHPARNADRYGKRGESLYAVQDATIACTFAMLAAAAQGIGSVWVGAFDESQVRQILDLPDGERPIILLPIGYPAELPERRGRRALSELVHPVS
ncbi:MAG: nitroreductase [Chloroflexi bacterium]|nr:nitroreductase [Chloroflexota bacterium]